MEENKTIRPAILYVIAGAVVLLGIVFYLAKTNPSGFQNLFGKLSEYFGTKKSAVVDTSLIKNDLSLKKINVLLPKSKVNFAYYDTFNNIINEIVLVDLVYREQLSPQITKLAFLASGENSPEYAESVSKIQNLNNVQIKRLGILDNYFNSLSAINETTLDKETNSMTAELINSGKKLLDSYSAYSYAISQFTSGKSAAQTSTQPQKIADNMSAAITSFRNITKTLTAYFTETIKTDLGTASSSSPSI